MGGGPTKQQKQAATSSAALSNTENDYMKQGMALQKQATDAAMPWYQGRMQTGLPFYNSLTDYTGGAAAQAYAPIRAQILRNTSQYGNLPSGYRDKLLTNLGVQQGHLFDQGITQNMFAQDQAKQQGAQGMMTVAQLANPSGWASGQGQLNSSIMQAPLQKPGIAGILGGVAQAGLNFAKA